MPKRERSISKIDLDRLFTVMMARKNAEKKKQFIDYTNTKVRNKKLGDTSPPYAGEFIGE